MTSSTPYDAPEGLLERLMFPSLRNAYREGAATVATSRDQARSERDSAEGQLHIRSDEAYEQRVRANRAEALLDEALLMIRNAPHGPHCSSRIAVPEPPRYGCDCWRAGL